LKKSWELNVYSKTKGEMEIKIRNHFFSLKNGLVLQHKIEWLHFYKMWQKIKKGKNNEFLKRNTFKKVKIEKNGFFSLTP